MVEFVSVGAAVVAVITATCTAALDGAVGEAAKEAYVALRERVARWAQPDVTALEHQPASLGRQAVLAEVIDACDEDERERISSLARSLVDALKSAPGGLVGLEMTSLEAAYVSLGSVTVTEGTGVRLGNVKLEHGLTVDSVSVGDAAQGKTHR